jgi:integrase
MDVRKQIRRIEDEDEEPTLREGRRLTVRELRAAFREEYVTTRSSRRSPRTLKHYDYLWERHLLPLIGDLRLLEVTTEVVRTIKTEIPSRVQAERPTAEGRYAANQALNQGQAVFNWARKMGYLVRNPFDFVDTYDVESAERCFEDHEIAAVGAAIRDAEELASRSSRLSRHVPSLTALYALRVAIYTGCRHREELLWGRLDWLKDARGSIPRIEVPRAKGQRGANRGRFLYLGPHATKLLLEIPRPEGSEHLLVPGRIAGRPLFRLNETWEWIAKKAGIGDAPPKVWRHTARTNHVRAGIAPEHSEQLLGHRGRPITDTVYLHRHGPSLAQAAAIYERYVRGLLRDLGTETAPGDEEARLGAFLVEAMGAIGEDQIASLVGYP